MHINSPVLTHCLLLNYHGPCLSPCALYKSRQSGSPCSPKWNEHRVYTLKQLYLWARSALVHEPWSNSVPERQYHNVMTRVEEDAKDGSQTWFNLTRLRSARSCGVTWRLMLKHTVFFSLKLMGWKLNDTCYMGCPSPCTKQRHIAREFWLTVSNFP